MAHAVGDDVQEASTTGLLHDVGKLAVPTGILDKRGALEVHEWARILRHPADSERILAAVPGWYRIAAVAAAHHERPDGRGYHRGLRGDAIPAPALRLAVADSFDAMTADRPYRAGMDPAEALRRLRDGAGTQFDAAAVEVLASVIQTPSVERAREHTAA